MHNLDSIANMCFVIFIVSFKFDSMLNTFTVYRMFYKTLNSNYNSFLHFVADYFTDTGNTRISFNGHNCFLLLHTSNTLRRLIHAGAEWF